MPHLQRRHRGKDAGEGVPAELREALGGAALAVWTTTAWTLPANQAVAVNERLRYVLVEAEVRCRRRCLQSTHEAESLWCVA